MTKGPYVRRWIIGCVVLLGSVLAAAKADAKPPKYYFRVLGALEAEGVDSHIADEAKALFVEELRRRPEVLLDWPDIPTDPAKLQKALAKRHLRALEVTLKILEVSTSITPAPKGKQYRVLERGIRMSIFGDSFPERSLALGGDGESTMRQEIGNHAAIDVEARALLLDAARSATAQAIDATITKLDLANASRRKRRVP